MRLGEIRRWGGQISIRHPSRSVPVARRRGQTNHHLATPIAPTTSATPCRRQVTLRCLHLPNVHTAVVRGYPIGAYITSKTGTGLYALGLALIVGPVPRSQTPIHSPPSSSPERFYELISQSPSRFRRCVLRIPVCTSLNPTTESIAANAAIKVRIVPRQANTLIPS